MIEVHPRKHIRVLSRILHRRKIKIGCEVGVWRGHTSYVLLQRRPELIMVGVDSYPQGHYIKLYDDTTRHDIRLEMLKLLGENPRFRFLEMDSVTAASKFRDEYFDFVFIDADHSFESTSADIQAWFPKVKRGGLLLGHDYNGTGDHMRRNPFGVKKAVDAFAEEKQLSVREHRALIWEIEKP